MPATTNAPADTLSSAERVVLCALGVAWIAPAWWLGASTVGGQALAAAVGGIAFVLARLAARRRLVAWPTSDGDRAGTVRVDAAPLFSPFVVFCALAFAGLLLCQALNPDRLLIPDRRPVGAVVPLAHRAWLPTGIAGPFDRQPGDFLDFANAWRHLLVVAAASLPLAALAALRRRGPFLSAVLGLLALHAAAFSAFAFTHNLSGSHAVLWLVSDAAFHLGAPQFPYKNQQAAYQVVLFALALAAWFAPAPLRPWPLLRRRNLWCGLLVALVFLGTVTTRSRAGLAGAAVLSALAAAFMLWPLRDRWFSRPRLLTVGAAAALVLAAGLSLLPPVRATLHRVAELAREPGDLLVGGSYRRILHDIAWQMTLDRPWLGHGAGSYVILFPEYQQRVPTFAAAVRRFQPNWNRPVHVHADGDWVEFTAEFGFVGTALFAAPWLVWLAALRRAWSFVPAAALLAAGAAFVLAHGWIDFVLRNPAVLGLAAVAALLALAIVRAAPARESLESAFASAHTDDLPAAARLHPHLPSA
ncbi:MAG TPA: O-antigen ligase family protein [Opitutaceae bacterium]|nr:O-antigen ligase family protein [Opitutaceae bacterium]